MASHLHLSKQRVQRETTSTEFVLWKVFREQVQPNDFNATHQFLAQIALEVRRVLATDPSKFTLENFLLTFGPKTKEPTKPAPAEPATDSEIAKQRTALAKAMWRARTGVKKNADR